MRNSITTSARVPGRVSVGALLIIGRILPGVLTGICLLVAVTLIGRRRGYPLHPRASCFPPIVLILPRLVFG